MFDRLAEALKNVQQIDAFQTVGPGNLPSPTLDAYNLFNIETKVTKLSDLS